MSSLAMRSNASALSEHQGHGNTAHGVQLLMQLDYPELSGTSVGDLSGNGKLEIPDRSGFSPMDTIEYIWKGLGLPEEALKCINLKGGAV